MYISLIPSQAEHFSLSLLATFISVQPTSCSYSLLIIHRVVSLFLILGSTSRESVTWAANIFHFLSICLSLHQSPVVPETWDHSTLIFTPLLPGSPSATWPGGGFAEKNAKMSRGVEATSLGLQSWLTSPLFSMAQTISYIRHPQFISSGNVSKTSAFSISS